MVKPLVRMSSQCQHTSHADMPGNYTGAQVSHTAGQLRPGQAEAGAV